MKLIIQRSLYTTLPLLILLQFNMQPNFAQAGKQNEEATPTEKIHVKAASDASAVTIGGGGNFTLSNSGILKPENSSEADNNNQLGVTKLIKSANFRTNPNSTLAITLQNGSTLKGWINKADSAQTVNLTMDATSSWIVTLTSYINGTITNPGIFGSSVNNITGNGNNVYYTPDTNPSLEGLIYRLVNGGYLIPKGVTAISKTTDGEEFIQFKTYPNPFDEKTTILVYLPQSSAVQLSAVNMRTGKINRNIWKGNLTAGSNQFDLNPSEKLTQGQYILVLNVTNQNGKFVKTTKIIKQ
jgi:hypothetical protein